MWVVCPVLRSLKGLRVCDALSHVYLSGSRGPPDLISNAFVVRLWTTVALGSTACVFLVLLVCCLAICAAETVAPRIRLDQARCGWARSSSPNVPPPLTQSMSLQGRETTCIYFIIYCLMPRAAFFFTHPTHFPKMH